MSDFITASEVRETDSLVGWEGYRVLRYELHPNGRTGRIQMRDRYGLACWTPKDPDEKVEIETRGENR